MSASDRIFAVLGVLMLILFAVAAFRSVEADVSRDDMTDSEFDDDQDRRSI